MSKLPSTNIGMRDLEPQCHPRCIKKSLASEILTSWEISPEHIPLLEKYYLLHWNGEYFSTLYNRTSGRFLHQDCVYQIIFHEGSMSEVLTAAKVLVSFRKESKLYPYGYALVKVDRS